MMTLHNNIKDFAELIQLTAAHFGISPDFVEKDYWITSVLKRLALSANTGSIVFKGGTSLSKGYRLINRFSEDIDIAMINENLTGNALKTKTRSIEKEITTDLTEIIEPEITSKGSMFRKSVFQYPVVTPNRLSSGTPKRIIIEINSFANPYPYAKQTITSFIAEYLHIINQKEAIEEYGLQPFSINVLDKSRTMVEKLVSVVRFSFNENPVKAIASKIRHFYDLYFLANDEQCKAYLYSDSFKKDFAELYAHDQRTFDTPTNWQGKTVEQSPLTTDFPALWDKLKDTYRSELSQLAFSVIPEEKDVAESFHFILQQINHNK
ncbi:nucleotidyl transferase AbiEii/AbiGii toxin family protein [uncultured Bacteroides sp.]|uniref:nucleotidyl transferase AbiEii/AbiGii toxin family protein n=1 Tax=uncultured Bacteroides sp. TaxID=162156 RepID=UPI002AA5F219|nr:nucleotidyl transferase AbiEii/AbiGii toxin family protein [uncultured Bacteroides sp.]